MKRMLFFNPKLSPNSGPKMLQKSHHSFKKVNKKWSHFSGSKTGPFSGLKNWSSQRSLKQNQWFCNRLWTMLVPILCLFFGPENFWKLAPSAWKMTALGLVNYTSKDLFTRAPIQSNCDCCRTQIFKRKHAVLLFSESNVLQRDKAKLGTSGTHTDKLFLKPARRAPFWEALRVGCPEDLRE